MGLWSGNASAGNLLGTFLCVAVLSSLHHSADAWMWSLEAGAASIVGGAGLVWCCLHQRPSSVGLPDPSGWRRLARYLEHVQYAEEGGKAADAVARERDSLLGSPPDEDSPSPAPGARRGATLAGTLAAGAALNAADSGADSLLSPATPTAAITFWDACAVQGERLARRQVLHCRSDALRRRPASRGGQQCLHQARVVFFVLLVAALPAAGTPRACLRCGLHMTQQCAEIRCELRGSCRAGIVDGRRQHCRRATGGRGDGRGGGRAARHGASLLRDTARRGCSGLTQPPLSPSPRPPPPQVIVIMSAAAAVCCATFLQASMHSAGALAALLGALLGGPASLLSGYVQQPRCRKRQSCSLSLARLRAQHGGGGAGTAREAQRRRRGHRHARGCVALLRCPAEL